MPNEHETAVSALKDGKPFYYPEDYDPPYIESPLDSMRYSNSDISLDEAVANCGGRFFVCNANILNAEW
jgi:hypothetical protein